MSNFEIARENMVEGQIRPNQVRDADLIEVLSHLPREKFVPAHMQGFAYIDEDIDLGNGRFMQEPMVLARLVQAANVRPTDIVLDIGSGMGYSTAVLAQLASTVVGIEENEKLAIQAEELLKSLDITNAVIFHSGLVGGYPEQALYDVIYINGAVPEVPVDIFEQLVDGGRLVTVVGEEEMPGKAMLYTRVRDVISEKVIFDATSPFLKEFARQDSFLF